MTYKGTYGRVGPPSQRPQSRDLELKRARRGIGTGRRRAAGGDGRRNSSGKRKSLPWCDDSKRSDRRPNSPRGRAAGGGGAPQERSQALRRLSGNERDDRPPREEEVIGGGGGRNGSKAIGWRGLSGDRRRGLSSTGPDSRPELPGDFEEDLGAAPTSEPSGSGGPGGLGHREVSEGATRPRLSGLRRLGPAPPPGIRGDGPRTWCLWLVGEWGGWQRSGAGAE